MFFYNNRSFDPSFFNTCFLFMKSVVRKSIQFSNDEIMSINFLETLGMQLKWPDGLRLLNRGVWSREYGVCMFMIGQPGSGPIKLLKFENSIILWSYSSPPLVGSLQIR